MFALCRRSGPCFKATSSTFSNRLRMSSTNHSENRQVVPQRDLNDIFIIGAGCIGLSLTASLLNSNGRNRVFLIGRTPEIQKIQDVGVTVTGAVEAKYVPHEQFIASDTISRDLLIDYQVRPKSIVFLSTKTCDAVASLAPFQRILSPLHPVVICLQNGLGIEEKVEKVFRSSQATILKGHVFGAVHKKEGSLFAYKGRIIVGNRDPEITGDLREVFGQPNSGIFDLEISPNILKAIYPKVAVNCVCNPLTVILNQNIGLIKTHYEPLVRMICREVYEVARSQEIDLSSIEELTEIVLETMRAFSSHYSSTYLDHQEGERQK